MNKYFFFLILLTLPLPLWAAEEKEYHTVTKVIDGMTLEVDGKDTIRLIGVKTPSADSSSEAVRQWSEKAKEFTKSLVEGRQVWLEYGGKDKKTDEKGATWAYVFFTMKLREMQPLIDRSYIPFWGTAGNFMLNRLLVELGYATASSPFSFKYRSQFSQIEKTARDKEYGMWQYLKY